MMTGLFRKCTRRLTVTFNQENKRIEIMNGNSTQLVMFSDMAKRELRMVLLWHYTPRDTKINSQKLQLLRRLLKIIEQLLKTS